MEPMVDVSMIEQGGFVRIEVVIRLVNTIMMKQLVTHIVQDVIMIQLQTNGGILIINV